jgi:NAD(P)-dependent dehydrogenase (short-subunit alcohol dehydrogenase family)
MTSSEGYKFASRLDYDSLSKSIPNDGSSIFHLKRSFLRYCTSKLAIIYLTLALSRQITEGGIHNIRVNACHPGRAPTTEIGDFNQTFMSPAASRWIKWILTLGYRVGNSVEDAARTQVFLVASGRVGEEDVRGEYWVPRLDWWGRWVGCEKEDLTVLGRDEGEVGRLWGFCEGAVAKAVA